MRREAKEGVIRVQIVGGGGGNLRKDHGLATRGRMGGRGKEGMKEGREEEGARAAAFIDL